MPGQARILVLRFSAMGDVAMTAPVLRELQEQNPGCELIVVSRALFEPFFEGIPRLKFHPIEPKGKHKGLFGLLRLFNELRSYRITAVADLHQNLRSRTISSLFRFAGVKVETLNKGRSEKKQLTRKENKFLKPLKPMPERYADVFMGLGLKLQLQHKLIHNPEPLQEKVLALTGDKKSTDRWIGIAPFAQHLQKVYPLEKMEWIVNQLAEKGYKIWIFGGGQKEQKIAEQWEQVHKNSCSLVGKLSLKEELNLISNLDLMLSMDSAGMHMASLKGIPVVSIWGATHPFAGFLGYGQELKNCVQLDLACRPCSVYGNKACYRGDFACMNTLSEVETLKIITDTLS